MKIQIEGLEEVKKALGNHAKQLPFALSKAINDTAYGARNAVVDELKAKLDRPTPYILKSAVYSKSTKKDLTAAVALVEPSEFVYDISGGEMKGRADQTGGPTPRALIPHLEGGGRKMKPFEYLIKKKLGLPESVRLVPGRGAWLDQYGNIPHGEINKIISEMQAWPERGYKANSTGKSRGYFRNFRYFVMYRSGHPVGIFAREKRSNSVQPVLIFVYGAGYKKRLDFYGTVRGYVEQHFQANFDKTLSHAIKTAK